MKLLLEGPDNAGKTTLARAVHDASQHTFYFHPGGKPKDLADEVKCIETQLQVLNNDRVIMDRCTPISQMVYNPDPNQDIFRRQQLRHYMQDDIIVIYARPSTDRLMRVQDLTWREDETEEHKQKIIQNQHTFIQRYDKVMAEIPCVSYDFEDSFANTIRIKLIQAMNGSMADFHWFRNLMFYRGI